MKNVMSCELDCFALWSTYVGASQVALMVKNLPVSAGDKDTGSIPGSGRSPGCKVATHFVILAWEILWTEEPDGLQSMGLQRIGHHWAQSYFTYVSSFDLHNDSFHG